ncbi:hypothetical protein ACFW35_13875 [Fictibacillus sp. NPDC058756]|uniref:hypothetical protein n=1 Tax=Fictibacillus sp. NPDC058756 TaxID=3346625 RepID=UPI0036BDDD54
MLQSSRLSGQELYQIFNTNKYGTTNVKGYGQVIAMLAGFEISQNVNKVHLIIYTPAENIYSTVRSEDIVGWTPYTGPIPPQFGHQGGLPGGMGGQGYGQGQAFPSPWGGQGSQGGWGTWGY